MLVLGDHRGDNHGDQVDHFDHGVQGRASRVFQRVADGVADDAGLVALGALAQVVGGVARLIFDDLLGSICSSAINGTLFGASRMLADIARDGILPVVLARRNRKMIPYYSLLLMYLMASLFVLFGALESIVAFSSMTFLLVSLAVGIANLKLHRETGSHPGVVLLSLGLMLMTVGLMIGYLWGNDRETLEDIGLIYLLIIVLFLLFRLTRNVRRGRP